MTLAEAVVEIRGDRSHLKATLIKSERELRKSVDKMKANVKQVSTAMVGFGVAIGASFGLLTKVFIDAGVQMEKMMKGLIAVSGSAQEATKQLVELREVAKLPGLGLNEVVQASIKLQAVRISAEKATFYIAEMGNALATVGAGKAELAGVVRGMFQMQSRGKVLAEEINQISERIPQFRAAMLDAFGPDGATSEGIQKMGITVEEFLDRTVKELAKLPRVAGGTANAIENLRDAWQQLATSLGEVLLPVFTKIVDALANVVEFLNNLTDTQKSILAWATVITAGVGVLAVALGGLGLLLPGVTASLGAFAAVFGSLMTVGLGPLSIGITAISVAVIGLALAFKEYGKSRETVRLEEDTAALKRNIAGLETEVSRYTKAIAEIEKQARSGKKAISLLGTSLKEGTSVPGFGAAVLPIEEQLERVQKRLKSVLVELNFLRKTPAGIPGPKADESAAKGVEMIGKITAAQFVRELEQRENLRIVRSKEKNRQIDRAKEVADEEKQRIEEVKQAELQAMKDRTIANKRMQDDLRRDLPEVPKKFLPFRVDPDIAGKALRDRAELIKQLDSEREARADALEQRDKRRMRNNSKDLAEAIKLEKEFNDFVEKSQSDANRKRVRKAAETLRALQRIERNRIFRLSREWGTFTDSLQSSFTNTFADMLSKGELSWAKFAKNLKNIFIRQLSEIAVSAAFRGIGNLFDNLTANDFSSSQPAPANVGGIFGQDEPPPFLAPAAGAQQAPGISIIIQNDIQHISQVEIVKIVQKQWVPALRDMQKRGILATRA